MARRRNNTPQVPFTYKLVLNQWLFSLFGLESSDGYVDYLGRKLPLLEAFKERFQINQSTAEGMDENNIHHFHYALVNQTEPLGELPPDVLLEYDQNIVRHTQRLNERRLATGEEPITWKYFQYLTLLFTEIFLDRYFRDPEELRIALNQQIEAYNAEKPDADQLPPLDEDGEAQMQLNKLAYWMATGSGKTLIMHVNILQYQHYLEKHGQRRDLNRIILLTPNEGLSRQHRKEFKAAGILAELFNKDGRGLFAGRAVEIIDIHKLRDEMGDKTIAVDAFESNNLVLIDEGHRGATRGEEGTWMRFRNALCEKGFSFEYSATFGQAVKGNNWMMSQYARCVLFDYSYRFFYGDGYGKDYQILNLDEETEENYRELYLAACLLSFFQQQRLFHGQEQQFRPFNLEKPLWIFVGGSVTAGLGKKDATDIMEILLFLARFVSDRKGSVDRIERVLNEGLRASDGRNIFAGRFSYLNTAGLSASQIFDEILSTLFNAPGGGSLHVENLKGATGEVALKLGGDHEPFGVINVGDDTKLCNLCDKRKELVVTEREFSGSLFREINDDASTVNILIGSKKFTEGWNSWRVSTMGLMNVGSTEGSQIIQLFGRGVRLKGYEWCLKRSGKTFLPEEMRRPKHISVLETLNIFGIKADYMAQFRDFLEEEGLPPNEERIELLLPIIKNLGSRPLKTIRLKNTINGVSTEFGDAFKKLGPIPTLQRPDPETDKATEYLQKNQVVLNWYPKIQAMKSRGIDGGDEEERPDEGWLTAKHVAFLDLDAIYFELQRYKAERAWHNFNLSPVAIRELLEDQSWYRLLIPEKELAFDSFEKVRLWQEIAMALLKKYAERYYTFRKLEWELPHLEYRDLSPNDPNFPEGNEEFPDGYYRILIEESEEEIVTKLKELKTLIEAGDLKSWEFRGMKAIWFDRHLYQPLIHLTQKLVEISPVSLNKGERRFVEDLKGFHDNAAGFFEDKELYLLRNMSRGRGVGFFEAGNFHPDFILWLLVDDRQYITFVDPKGVRNVPWDDPKIHFYATIKDIEQRLRDPAVILNSFIVSNTPSHTMRMHWGVNKAEMEARHVFFQDEDKDVYIRTMLESTLAAAAQ